MRASPSPQRLRERWAPLACVADCARRGGGLRRFTVKIFDPTGLLLATSGKAGATGGAENPIRYNTVADTTFGKENMVYISDGDGSTNHRVVALNVSSLSDSVVQKPAWVAGNNHTRGAAGLDVYGHDITSAHSIAWHERTDTLFVADRENNRTLHMVRTLPPSPPSPCRPVSRDCCLPSCVCRGLC